MRRLCDWLALLTICFATIAYGPSRTYSQSDGKSYSYAERLKIAAVVQVGRNASEDSVHEQLAASSRNNRRAMQEKSRHQQRLMEAEFHRRQQAKRDEEAARGRQEALARLRTGPVSLDVAIARMRAGMADQERLSGARVQRGQEAQAAKDEAKAAEQRAKAEAYRERVEQIMMAIATGGATGGSSLGMMAPTMQGAGGKGTAPRPHDQALTPAPAKAAMRGTTDQQTGVQHPHGLSENFGPSNQSILQPAESLSRPRGAASGPPSGGLMPINVKQSPLTNEFGIFGPNGVADLSRKPVDARGANGCTLSPDRIGPWKTKGSCDLHDICYSLGSNIPRSQCDVEFFNNLLDAGVPLPIATSYFTGVTLFGSNYYKGNLAD